VHLRNRQWFDELSDPGITALYLERYLDFGLTRKDLQSGRPIIGIAQTGNYLATDITSSWPIVSVMVFGRSATGLRSNFPFTPFRKLESVRPPRWIEALLILAWSRSSTAIRSTELC
jgi:dihydroxy-acid dehydratase